jgi:type II secretory pathway pseudopilin PulG
VVIAIIALLISVLLPALGEARRTARTVRCLTNMKQLGVAMHTYAAEFKEQLYSYSWKANVTYTSPGQPSYTAGTDVDAACNQMADIVRRRGDRTVAEAPVIGAFFPYLRYTHLVIQDYLSQALPDPIVACPEDRLQAQWGQDPRGYDNGLYTPDYGHGVGTPSWRWPYRSNYWITVSAFDKNPIGSRAFAADYGHINLFIGPNVHFGNRKISDVAFMSSKVFMYEQYGRHISKKFDYRAFFGFNTARPIVQMFDNSVSIKASKDANLGNADPNAPNGTLTQTQYTPPADTPDPLPPEGTAGRPSTVYYQYSRSGLKGIDFGGNEVRGTAY